jgi:hypothetical protein
MFEIFCNISEQKVAVYLQVFIYNYYIYLFVFVYLFTDILFIYRH